MIRALALSFARAAASGRSDRPTGLRREPPLHDGAGTRASRLPRLPRLPGARTRRRQAAQLPPAAWGSEASSQYAPRGRTIQPALLNRPATQLSFPVLTTT